MSLDHATLSKEPQQQVDMDRLVTSGSLVDVMVSTRLVVSYIMLELNILEHLRLYQHDTDL